MRTVAAGTIAAKRELPYARVLARSFAEHHPEIPFFVLLADEVEGCFDPSAEPFELLGFDELQVPWSERFRFVHPRKPLSYAATPYFLSALLDRGFEQALFLKQESLVVGSQEPVLQALEQCAIALTPHLLTPLEGEDAAARELNILQSGVYNAGLLGVRHSPAARRFLAWWADRVSDCRHAIGEGMHYEQRWLDLVPVFFDDVCLIRDPGANIGHWNLPERVADERRLVRFSGFDPNQPDRVTVYSDRVSMGELAGLFGSYSSALKVAGWDEAQSWPYAYDRFANGVAIPELARELYRELGDDAGRFDDPFSTGEGSFFRWLNEPVGGLDHVTRLWHAVYLRRPDVREAFPDVSGTDHDGFASWRASSGLAEHGISAAFLGD